MCNGRRPGEGKKGCAAEFGIDGVGGIFGDGGGGCIFRGEASLSLFLSRSHFVTLSHSRLWLMQEGVLDFFLFSL